MNWYKGIVFLALIVLISCGSSQESEEALIKPDWLIPADKMELILKDIQYAEEAVHVLNIHYDSIRPTVKKFYFQVFEIHDVSPEEFDSSFNYYISHPKQLSDIYYNALSHMQTDEIKMKDDYKASKKN